MDWHHAPEEFFDERKGDKVMHHAREYEATWLGRRARAHVEYDTANENGPRWVTMTWIDDATPENGSYPAGTVTLSRVTGFWRTGIEVLEPTRIISQQLAR